MDLNKLCLFEVVCALKLRLFIFTTVKDDKQMKFGAHCCSSCVLPHNVSGSNDSNKSNENSFSLLA